MAGDDVRIYYSAKQYGGRLGAAVVSVPIYPDWAGPCADSEAKAQ